MSAESASGAVIVVVIALALISVILIVIRVRKAASTDASATAKSTADAVSAATTPDAAPAAAKTVLDYIDARTIVLDIDDTDRDTVIRRLAELMTTTGRVLDVDAVVRAALERELISTTGIGEGIAIPHAMTDSATSPVLAFARSRPGVDWKSLDEAPAHLIFMIAVPEMDVGTEHLKVLAQLSRSLMNPAFRSSIEMAATPADVLAALAASVRATPH